jgi:hypothetical protein
MRTLKMDIKKTVAQQWQEDAAKYLVGRKIVSVGYMTKKECLDNMWDRAGLILELDDGTFMYPLSDDEGNSPGAYGTTIENLPIIPMINLRNL